MSTHNLHKHFKLTLISATLNITLTYILFLHPVPHKAAGMPQLTKGEGGGGEPADCTFGQQQWPVELLTLALYSESRQPFELSELSKTMVW